MTGLCFSNANFFLGGHVATTRKEQVELPEAEIQFLRRVINDHEWRFAKTMPENPHFYMLRRTWDNRDDFLRFVTIIRDYGFLEIYEGYPYTILHVDGWKYWWMGEPVGECDLINRKDLSGGRP